MVALLRSMIFESESSGAVGSCRTLCVTLTTRSLRKKSMTSNRLAKCN